MFCIMLLNKEIRVLFLQEGSYTKYPPLSDSSWLPTGASLRSRTVKKGCLWPIWGWVSETACSLGPKTCSLPEIPILGASQETYRTTDPINL